MRIETTTAQRIKALCALHGWTLTDLARRLGLSQPALSYRLNGIRPWGGLASLPAVANALGVPLTTIEHGAPWPDVSTSHG